MSNFLITKFKSRTSNVEYHKHPTQNDLFINSNNTQDTKKVMDFMCSPTYQIKAVKRLTDGQEFEIGVSRINYTTQYTNRNISSIFIKDGQIYLAADSLSTQLINAVKYVIPQPAPVAVVNPPALAAVQAEMFTTIQNKILAANTRAIRLPGLLRNRKTETLKQFLVKFFKEWNEEKDTIYADNRDVQTAAGKRRSIGDLFMICRYYFPNTTVKQLYNCLINELPTAIPDGFRGSYCNTINKYVFYFNEGGNNGFYDRERNNEYGYTFTLISTNLA